MIGNVLEHFIKSLVIVTTALLFVATYIASTRRIYLLIQSRSFKVFSKNRKLSFLSDLIKLISKEDVESKNSKAFYYHAIPTISLVLSLLPLAAIPLCGKITFSGINIFPEVVHSEIGLFFIIITLTISSLPTLLLGWITANKYSMLSSIRECAQIVSLQGVVLVVFLAVFVFYGSFDLHEIIAYQATNTVFGFPAYGIITQPLGAFVLLSAIVMTSQSKPIGLNASGELMNGYLVEFTSVKYIMLVLAEHLRQMAYLVLFVFLFLGGYSLLPGLEYLSTYFPELLNPLQYVSLVVKILIVVWLLIWIQLILPRAGSDRTIKFAWKQLFIFGFLNIIGVIVLRVWV